MPRSGGESEKLGNRYQGWWTVQNLLDLLTGEAQYEYGPFGELLRSSGPATDLNPFSFSTKYRDPESGFSYYGYRFLREGQWLNRDPADENGDRNLYDFVRNDPLDGYDSLGLKSCCCCCAENFKVDGPYVMPIVPTGPSYGSRLGNTFGVSADLAHENRTVKFKAFPELKCSVKCEEKYHIEPTSRVDPNRPPPDIWVDVVQSEDQRTGSLPSNTTVFSAVHYLRKLINCPSTYSLHMWDSPYVDIPFGETGYQDLSIKVTISSAPDCPCIYRTFQVVAEQHLKWENGLPPLPPDPDQMTLSSSVTMAPLIVD